MAIIKKTITGLKPDTNYIFSLKPKNVEIAAADTLSETVRINIPSYSSNPNVIGGLQVSANFQSILIKFDPVDNIDLDYYEYQIYDNNIGSGDPINSITSLSNNPIKISGFSKSNVFVVSLENSSQSINPVNQVVTTVTKQYWVRVRAVNTSKNPSTLWTGLVQSGQLNLIQDQFIANLTAAKITAGTIGAHTITLAGATSIIKSSTYNSTQGWQIDGQGNATFNTATIRGELLSGTSPNWFRVDANGNIWSGADTFTNAATKFRVSNAGVLTAASGTVGGWTINPSYIKSSNSLVTLNSNGLFEIGTNANDKATITSNGNFTVYGSDGGSGFGNTRMYGGFLNIKKGSTPTDAQPNIQLTYSTLNFFNTTTNVCGINGGNDGGDPYIYTVGVNSYIQSGGYIYADKYVQAASNMYVQNGGTYAADTTFRTTGSSTTARLTQFELPGFDALARPTSLRELKENIEDISDALQMLGKLRPRKYNFKHNAFSELDPITGLPWTEEAKELAKLDHKYGFIVEEVLETNPDLISYTFENKDLTNKEEKQNYLDFSKWKPTMWEDIDVLVLCVKAIQELSAKVDEMESRLL